MKGLEKIREYFGKYPDNYIVIGGTAYNIIASEASFNERTTKDIDMILVEEEMNRNFLERFWTFIKDGGYSVGNKMTEEGNRKRVFYRFVNPTSTEFPEQIELCSRKPDGIELPPDVRVVHIENVEVNGEKMPFLKLMAQLIRKGVEIRLIYQRIAR